MKGTYHYGVPNCISILLKRSSKDEEIHPGRPVALTLTSTLPAALLGPTSWQKKRRNLGALIEVSKLPVCWISPQPDQEGNKLRSMSWTRAISTKLRRNLSSRFFFSARQGAEGNSRHSDKNISLFSSWSD